MYSQTLHHDSKHFCRYFIIFFVSTAKILERHVNDCFEVNVKEMIKIAKKCEIVNFKNYTTKIKSPFMIYTDFESILVAENDGSRNPDESYTNKYQNHVGCSFAYKLVCVDDQFGKPFELYIGQDDIHKFITNMVEESK